MLKSQSLKWHRTFRKIFLKMISVHELRFVAGWKFEPGMIQLQFNVSTYLPIIPYVTLGASNTLASMYRY